MDGVPSLTALPSPGDTASSAQHLRMPGSGTPSMLEHISLPPAPLAMAAQPENTNVTLQLVLDKILPVSAPPRT
eukprot:15366733-Ditylum_brightwellii.AAC.2